MAKDDELDFYDRHEEEQWDRLPARMQDDRFMYVQFHAFMDPGMSGDMRARAYIGLDSYSKTFYGVDFADYIDWKAWQDWYDSL